jgi:arylsulfatase A-like enzyme
MTEAELGVPLVVAAPGLTSGPAPRVEVAQARQIDLVPTILDLLGLSSDAPVQGRSLLGGGASPPAYLDGFGACEVGGLVEGDTKYEHDFETGETWSVSVAGDTESPRRTPLEGSAAAAIVARLEACRSYNTEHVRREVP